MGTIFVLLTACKSSDKKLTLNTPEELAQIQQLMVAKFGADSKFLELNFTTENPRHLYFEQTLFQNKNDHIIYSFPYDNVVQQASALSEKQKQFTPISLGDFDVSEFTKIKQKAIALIMEKSTNFADFSAEKIVYSVVGNQQLSYDFQLIGIKKNDKISYVGKKIYHKENLYRFRFYYDGVAKKLRIET